jgi:hypothetical protein
LKKLGIRTVSRTTVINILKEHGLGRGPLCGRGHRDEYLKQHAQMVLAFDFFSRKVYRPGAAQALPPGHLSH